MEGKTESTASSKAAEPRTQRIWNWFISGNEFFGYKISGEQVACPAVHIILGNRLYIIHCTSCLKHIQASGKSEGSWSDATSNNAFEAPTDDRYDG